MANSCSKPGYGGPSDFDNQLSLRTLTCGHLTKAQLPRPLSKPILTYFKKVMSQAAYAFNRGKKVFLNYCLNLQHARLMTDLLTPDIQRSGFSTTKVVWFRTNTAFSDRNRYQISLPWIYVYIALMRVFISMLDSSGLLRNCLKLMLQVRQSQAFKHLGRGPGTCFYIY